MEYLRARWDGDWWSCPAQPAQPLDAFGLPALPARRLEPAPTVEASRLQTCMVHITFPSTPHGSDPLLEDAFALPAAATGEAAIHLRWLSSAWWCAHPSVVGVLPMLRAHPRQNCLRRTLNTVSRAAGLPGHAAVATSASDVAGGR